jgi:hypothetical protein
MNRMNLALSAVADWTTVGASTVVELCYEDDEAMRLFKAYAKDLSQESLDAVVEYIDGCF